MKVLLQSVLKSLVIGCVTGCLCCSAGCGSTPRSGDKPAAEQARSYAFWPQFPDDPHIQFVASYASSEDVTPTKVSGLDRLVFGTEATKAALIDKPYGVAMRDGRIYVCDMRSKALVVLDLKKKQTRLIGVSGLTPLEHPVAVAVAEDGMIYVADNARGVIFVFDTAEKYSKVFGFDKFKPVSVAVHGDRLYATDLTGQRVEVFDRRDGKRLGTIGSLGDEDGQFRVPLGVSTDKAGNVYVVDMMRCRIQKFSPEGKLLAATGVMGDFAGSFARPKHIAVDSDGIIYVVDASFQNVQMFDDQNRLLMHFGSAGNYPGSMNLPAGVAVCEDSLDLFRDRLHPGFEAKRLVVVTNQFGPTKVVVYAMGGLRAGYTAQQLAAAAAPMESGMGTPSAEQLKLQAPGGEEAPVEPGAPEGGTPTEQPPPKKPDSPAPPPKPAEPK